MARAIGPLLSQKASKQLGKTLIYKTKGDKSFITRYNKPGGKNPFTPSTSQAQKRTFYAAAVQVWRDKTNEQKTYWNNLATQKNLHMSGWNLFYKTAFTNPEGYLGTAKYGKRLYGYFKYGKVQSE